MNMNTNIIIAKKYKVLALVGKGQFGEVNKGSCLKTQKIIAIKMERKDAPYRMLKHEATVLNYLINEKCSINIPKIFYYGSHGPYMCIVTSFFSEGSLDSLKNELTLNEKIKWWNTAVDILSHVHEAGIVHRDIKPHHFMRNENHDWFLIDFGLATTYLMEKDQEQHIEERDTDHIIGSPNYVSWFVHHGKDAVRRDDFLSLIYVLWELLHGSFLTDLDTLPKIMCITSIHDEFNVWLRNQKEFDRLQRLLSLLPRQEDMKMMMNTFLMSLLTHAQHLSFKEKPIYLTFTVHLHF